ncbi:DUF6531 domain-containing protein [Halovulum sp. GXIMD14793]
MSLYRFFLICLFWGLASIPGASQAQTGSGPEIPGGPYYSWTILFTGNQYPHDDPVEGCFWHQRHYNGTLEEAIKVNDAKYICLYTSGESIDINKKCASNYAWPGTAWWGWANAPADESLGGLCVGEDDLVGCTSSSPNTGAGGDGSIAGNPIATATGTKIERNLDWSSPIDARFKFSRTYRGDFTMANSPITRSHSLGWASNWELMVTGTVGKDYIVHRNDAMRYKFIGDGATTPKFGGHHFSLQTDVASENGRHVVGTAGGRTEYYSTTATGEKSLSEIR